MRNLKRALSLTLASVMLLGMMVVGAGAAGFPDVTDEENVEAIEVLQAVEVMVGDDNGNFGPNDPVNRSQMAVVMAKLLNYDYDYYEASCPFWDVPTWARPYVGACYANGIVSGYGDGTYGAADGVTAVQAASMMMRALGYFKYSSDYKDGFETATIRQGTKIGIFNGVGSKVNEPLTRNQVAQMALNALKTPIVEPSDKTINIVDGNGNLVASGGQVDYVVIASRQDYAQSIDNVEYSGDGLNQVNGWTVELGEQLYNGDLQLNDNSIDDFGRHARYWEYDGKAIGTYYKKELMVKEYVGKVTGKDLYDQLGSTIIKDYNLNVAVDGVDQDDSAADKDAAGVFGSESMDKNNKAAVGRTGTGTLTQVFVDNRNAAVNKEGRIYIAVINTYLAKASRDYDEKKEELTVTIHGAKKMTSGNYVKFVRTESNQEIPAVSLAVEDFPIVKDMKDGQFLLVNLAKGGVAAVGIPEVLAGVNATGFKINSDIVVDGTSEVITYKLDKGSAPVEGLHNTWCTYTKDSSNVYTLREVDSKLDAAKGVDLAQFATSSDSVYNNGFTIDSKHISINTGTANDKIIYGKEDTVYMVAELDILNKTTELGAKVNYGAIKDVDTTIVDIKNTDLEVWSKAKAEANYNALKTGVKVDPNYFSYGTYALYNDNHGIIAAVVVGEDNGATKSWYWTGDQSLLHEDYEENSTETRATYKDGEWVWTRELFDENGKLVLMTERGDSSSYLERMKNDHWYQIKLNAKGEVYKAYKVPGADEDKIFDAAPVVVYEGTDLNKTAKDAEVVTDPKLIGEAVEYGKNKMLVYCDVIGNTLNANDQGLLYVTTDDKTGLLVTKDTQIVLLQYNRNKLDTYTEGVGYDYLKGIVAEINARYKGTYDYQVSAVLNSGVAQSIMISDRNPDWNKPVGPQTGDVVFASNSGLVPGTGNGQDGIVKGTVTTLGSGDTNMSFTLTKPDWAYASASNINGSNVVVHFNVLVDGKIWCTDSSSRLTGGLYDRVAGQSYSGENGAVMTLESDGKTFTVSNFNLTGNTNLSAAAAQGSKVTVEITSVEWLYANVEYILDGEPASPFTENDGASAHTFINTRAQSTEFGVGLANRSSVAGKVEFTGITFSGFTAPTHFDDIGQYNRVNAYASNGTKTVQAIGHQPVVVAFTSDPGSIKYTVKIGDGTGSDGYGANAFFALSNLLSESDCAAASNEGKTAGIMLTPTSKQVVAGESVTISVNRVEMKENVPLAVWIEGIDGCDSTPKLIVNGQRGEFTIENVQKDITITARNVKAAAVFEPKILAVSYNSSGNYTAIQFDKTVTLDHSGDENNGWCLGRLEKLGSIVKADVINGNIVMIKWKTDPGPGFMVPEYSIIGQTNVNGTIFETNLGVSTQGSGWHADTSTGTVYNDTTAMKNIEGIDNLWPNW